uniref:Uncharacterized protein n=1 Tax=Mesocestoides corti TaxID=53468 RepID=A0A5K3FWT6_MESCO
MRCVESTSALVDVAIPHLLDVPSKALERLTLSAVHWTARACMRRKLNCRHRPPSPLSPSPLPPPLCLLFVVPGFPHPDDAEVHSPHCPPDRHDDASLLGGVAPGDGARSGIS